MKFYIVSFLVVLTARNGLSTSTFDENGSQSYYNQQTGYQSSGVTNYAQDSYSSYLQPQMMDTGYNVQPQNHATNYEDTYSTLESQYSPKTRTNPKANDGSQNYYKNVGQKVQKVEEPQVNPGDACVSMEANYYTTKCTPNGKSVSVCLNGNILAVVPCPTETPYCDPEKLQCTKSLKKALPDPKIPPKNFIERKKVPYRRPMKPVRRPMPTRIENRIYYTRYPSRRGSAPIRRRNGSPTPKIQCSNSQIKSKCTSLGFKSFTEAASLSLPNDRSKVSCLEHGSPERMLTVFDCPIDEYSCENVANVSTLVPACGLNECVQNWLKFSCVTPRVYLRRRYRRGLAVEKTFVVPERGSPMKYAPFYVGGAAQNVLPNEVAVTNSEKKKETKLPEGSLEDKNDPKPSKCAAFYTQCKFVSYSEIEEASSQFKGSLLSCFDSDSTEKTASFDCPKSLVGCVNLGEALVQAPGCYLKECNNNYTKIHCQNSV